MPDQMCYNMPAEIRIAQGCFVFSQRNTSQINSFALVGKQPCIISCGRKSCLLVSATVGGVNSAGLFVFRGYSTMAISKKTRFEVFKRDKFTCQYCGESAPEVVLEVYHIQPVSKGGDDDMLNLVTSCFDCNRGKRDRLLSDDTAIQRRKQQLDELQERREQLEMLVEWHRSLIGLDAEVVGELSAFWDELVPGYYLNDRGIKSLKKWLNRFNVNEILEAMRISTSQYLKYDDSSDDPTKPTHESVEKAWSYIPKICANKRRCKDKPYLPDLYYARGILRNRLTYVNEHVSIRLMEQAVLAGMSTDEVQDVAKQVTSWTQFKQAMEGRINGQKAV